MPSRLVRTYYAARYRRTAALSFVSAVFDGVWLGLLDEEGFGELDEAFYNATREQHDGETIGYADAAYTLRGLERWEQALLDEHLGDPRRILVTGAGGGREVLALCRAGHDAVGFEPNEALVAAGAAELARQGWPDRLFPMRRDALPDAPGPWEMVLIGWGAYMSVPGRAARTRLLGAARERLEPGGLLLVSGWHRSGDTSYDRRVKQVGSAVRRLRRRPAIELGDALVDCFVHRFTGPELAAEVRAAGFEPVASETEPYVWVLACAT